MNENIDLTKILKDCPKGWKLYSPIFGEIDFSKICDDAYAIVTIQDCRTGSFTKEGFYYADVDGECLLFPSKDQRDWSKFTAPWYKKKRDNIAWLKEQNKKSDDKNEPKFKAGDWLYANELNDYASLIKIVKIVDVFGEKRYKISRDYDSDLDLAEFDFIDKHYHLWTIQDAKDGDVLVDKCNNIGIFQECKGICWHSYIYLGCDDKLRGFSIGSSHEQTDTHPATKAQYDAMMKAVNNAGYKWNAKTKTLEKIVKPKFDPKTLKPFDRVLVRKGSCDYWTCDFFSHIIDGNDIDKYITFKSGYKCCIPYNHKTNHLVGTAEEAPEYYRYWED